LPPLPADDLPPVALPLAFEAGPRPTEAIMLDTTFASGS